jgi:hypothetical protein
MKKFWNKENKKPNKKQAESDTLEIPIYEIEIIITGPKIPQINLDHITVSTFDLSVTELKVAGREEKVIDDDGNEAIQQSPEIVFYLRVNSKNADAKVQSISLVNALLPHLHLIVSKCISIEKENIIGEMSNGTKYFKKLAYELICFTPEVLTKENLDYEEYRKELEQIQKRHLDEIAELKTNYKDRLSSMEEPYKVREKQQRDAINTLMSENFDLLFKIPQQRNWALKEALKKLNPMN